MMIPKFIVSSYVCEGWGSREESRNNMTRQWNTFGSTIEHDTTSNGA